MLMKDEEVAKVKLKSQYDDANNDWLVPPFILKSKEVTLPSLKKTGYDVMEQEKENRDLQIDGDSENNSSDGSAKRATGGGIFSQYNNKAAGDAGGNRSIYNTKDTNNNNSNAGSKNGSSKRASSKGKSQLTAQKL